MNKNNQGSRNRVRRHSVLSTQSSALSLTIADITLSLRTLDPSLKLELQGAIKSFSVKQGDADFMIEARWDDLSRIKIPTREVFNSGALWRLYENNGNYNFYFCSEVLGTSPYKMAEVRKDFTRSTVFLHRPYFDPSRPIYPLEYPLDELLFVHFLALGRGVEVHACGIVDPCGWGHLFFGQSGAGKSTMARLWQEEPGITILSDDRIVLRKMNGGFWMYGTPWHGEGRFSSPARALLKRVYFLEKGQKNQLAPYRPTESIGRLMACSFLPFYKREAIEFTTGFFEEMVKTVPTGELRFVPDKKVVEMINDKGSGSKPSLRSGPKGLEERHAKGMT